MTTKTTAVAATVAIPVAFAISSLSSSPSASHSPVSFQRLSKNISFGSLSFTSDSVPRPAKSGSLKGFANASSAVAEMNPAPATQVINFF